MEESVGTDIPSFLGRKCGMEGSQVSAEAEAGEDGILLPPSQHSHLETRDELMMNGR